MEKQLFISKCTEFFNEINYLNGNKLNIVFLDDENDEYFVFEPLTKSIGCNVANLESEQFKEWEEYLGNDFFKYIILHEYGHYIYDKKISAFFQKINDQNCMHPLIYNFDFDNLINNYDKSKSCIENAEDGNYYFGRQRRSTNELMADFFVKKAIKDFDFNPLDFSKYLNWRRESCLNSFNTIEKINQKHINSERTYYYHIYKALSENKFDKCNGDIDCTLNLALQYSQNIWVMCRNQFIKVYNKEDYINHFFI